MNGMAGVRAEKVDIGKTKNVSEVMVSNIGHGTLTTVEEE